MSINVKKYEFSGWIEICQVETFYLFFYLPGFIYAIFKKVLKRRSLKHVIYKDATLVRFINTAIYDTSEEGKTLKKISHEMGVKITETLGVSIFTLLLLLKQKFSSYTPCETVEIS